MNLTLKIWRQAGPQAKGHFEIMNRKLPEMDAGMGAGTAGGAV